jgi:hypothetical protein
MIGIRFARGEPDFFGWEEVNDFLRHGMAVVAVEPGGFFDIDGAGRENDPSRGHAWCYTVVLDDYGIDPAEV